MTQITYKDGIAIGELVVYFPALAIIVYLMVRDGIRSSSSWIFLNGFALARIIGACFQLATINNPTNVSLYVGASICLSIGFSPLELTALALLSRLLENINRTRPIPLKPLHMKLIENIVTAGMIVGIIGGVKAGDALEKTGVYTPQSLTKVGVGLFILSYVLLIASTFVTYLYISQASSGQRRILLGVALSLPFLLVRIIYSSISSFGHSSAFNIVSGNTTVLLCMALLTELAVVIVFEGIGLTLKMVPKYHYDTVRVGSVGQPSTNRQSDLSGSGGVRHEPQGQRYPGRGRRVVRHTLVGKLIASLKRHGNDNDKEMERLQG